MGAIPSTTNQAAETSDDIIHAAIFDFALQAASQALIAQAPVLALPILKQIVSGVLGWLGSYLYVALAHVVTFAIIDLQTAAEKTAYAQAEAKLRAAHLSGDSNALAQATADFKKALGSLIHFDGSASP